MKLEVAGTQARVSGPAEDHKSYGSWVPFSEPDGNSRFVREVTTRQPGRRTSALAAFDSVAGLAAAPRRAEAVHGTDEEETGQPDPNWPDWYAQCIADASAGRTGSA